MPDVRKSLDNLRDAIASAIADLETWATLGGVYHTLGLPDETSTGLGKDAYLRKVTAAASDQAIIQAAKRMIESYPGTRGKPSELTLQVIKDALWWIESDGIQLISTASRYRIAESLEGVRFWGRLSLKEFLAPILPRATEVLLRAGDDGFLYQESYEWVYSMLGLGSSSKPTPLPRVSTAEWLRSIGLAEWPDQRFCLFIERMVHPEVQTREMQQRLSAQLGGLLQSDGFELRQEGSQGGLPVYRIRRKTAGVAGSPKYIIFASSQYKPDIVISDTVNMDIRIVRYADQCLVYDQPPPDGDLTWHMLAEWWGKKTSASTEEADNRHKLGRRLLASLQSEPEKILFDTYFRTFSSKLGASLPALLPQVYLHYDPRSQSERGKPVLPRQRMDFLMLLRDAARIVIEIDGIQHYADDNGRASPQRYAEMVAEDRRIRVLGYEVYRFGGAEFQTPEHAREIIVTFFEELFRLHGIH